MKYKRPYQIMLITIMLIKFLGLFEPNRSLRSQIFSVVILVIYSYLLGITISTKNRSAP